MAMHTLTADARPAKLSGARTTPNTFTPTRRAFIGAVGLAATTIAAATTSDIAIPSDIERHWQARALAYRQFEADPFVLYDDRRAAPYWDRIDAAERAILNSSDTSRRAIEIRLWTAWSHTDREVAEAITQGDVATLRPRYAEFEWHEKMLFTAILNLRGEG